MRCQKCGFISFDQRPSCAKCGVDQTANAAAYTGTGQKTDPPFFLAAALGEATEQATPATELEVAIEEPVAEAVQDGATALFEELEAESQGMIPEEEATEINLSFDETEAEAEPEAEEITLEIPEEEPPVLVEAEEPQEITLEIPEPEEEDAVEEITAEQASEPEESLEITLEIPEEEVTAAAPAELTTDTAPPPPAEETIDLSLEMPSIDEDLVEEQGIESIAEPEQDTSTLDLEEIDLSDLVADSDSAPAQVSDNDEIFDLSSLMGDSDLDQNSDELDLSMDSDGEIALDAVEEQTDTDAEDGISGLSLEKED